MYQSGFRTNHSTLLFQQTFVLMKTNIFALLKCLQKTSGSRSIYSSWSYVFKTSSRRLQNVFKTSSKRLQNVFKASCKNIFKTTSRSLQDVFKTSSKRLQDIFKASCKVLQMSSSSRRFRDVSSRYTVLVNMFSRCLQDVFTTFLRRTAKTVIYTEGFALVTLLRNYGQCTKF